MAPPYACLSQPPTLSSSAAAAESASKGLSAALAGQAAWLAADSEAAQRLIEAMLGTDDEPGQELSSCVLPSADAASLGAALLAAAEAEAATAGDRASVTATALHVARALLGFAFEWAPAERLLEAAQKLLAAGSALPAGAPGSQEAQQREGLLTEAAACFTAGRLEALLRQQKAASAAAGVLDTWCSLLAPWGAGGIAAARLAALRQVQPATYDLLPAEVQGRCLKVRQGWVTCMLLCCFDCCLLGSKFAHSLPHPPPCPAGAAASREQGRRRGLPRRRARRAGGAAPAG